MDVDKEELTLAMCPHFEDELSTRVQGLELLLAFYDQKLRPSDKQGGFRPIKI